MIAHATLNDNKTFRADALNSIIKFDLTEINIFEMG
jgi:hypothetical protein